MTKKDTAPPPAQPVNQDEVSEITGSTRESKAQRKADAAVKEVTLQYSGQISSMQRDINDKDNKIAQLEMLLHKLNASSPDIPPEKSNSNEKKSSVPPGDDDDDDNLSYPDNEDDHALDSDQSMEPSDKSSTIPSDSKKRGLDDSASLQSIHSSKRAALTRSTSQQESPSNEGDMTS